MKIKDLQFKKLIDSSSIDKKVSELARKLNDDYKERSPILFPILNGSFMFAADLMKGIKIPCRVSFVKIASYSGTSSTGKLKTLIGHEESLFNQDILIVEDIVDTGLTLQKVMEELRALGAKSVEAVALLRKQPAREKKVDIKYIGFELEDEFVLGYGMDYDGLGRNLKDIYKQLG
jgi:hypoxanthine phosphoribosyltransferase